MIVTLLILLFIFAICYADHNERFGRFVYTIVLLFVAVGLVVTVHRAILGILTNHFWQNFYYIFVVLPFFLLILCWIIGRITPTCLIQTDYGTCECKLRFRKFKLAIIMSYEKVPNIIFKKDIFYFLKIHQTKYENYIIITGSLKKIIKLYYSIKNGVMVSNNNNNTNSKQIIKNLLKDCKNINIEYENREDKEKLKKINVNSASVKELSGVPFISIMQATKIKKQIKDNGEFTSLWQFAEFMNYEQTQINFLVDYVYAELTDKPQTQKEPEIKIDNLLDI